MLFKTAATLLIVGVGTAIAAPVVIPAIQSVGRPLAKSAIRGWFAVSGYATQFASEVGDQWRELVNEVRTENGIGPSVSGVAIPPPTPKSKAARA